MFEGTMPTKIEFEAADIFKEDSSGWIDVPKLETFLSGYLLVRRWKLDDFSKDIVPLDVQRLAFKFQDKNNDNYLESNDAYNVFSAGTVTWYLLRSIDTSNTLCHYMFSGTITDLEGGGDMEISRRTISVVDFVRPGTINVDLGALSVV
jgi:hypothetical protein